MKKTETSEPGRPANGSARLRTLLTFLIGGGVVAATLLVVFFGLDLKPQVDENFFFSGKDPQLKADEAIGKLFLQEPGLVVGAKGPIRTEEYLRRIKELTTRLSAVPGVDSVQSLTQGPRSPEAARKSLLWKRVLFSNDGQATFLYIFIKPQADLRRAVLAIESVVHASGGPSFRLMLSGTPYLVEVIQRKLVRDLGVFSLAALLLFGLSGFLISRSAAMALGTLLACSEAGLLTLIFSSLARIPIGPLTANLFTIVFVLTLTHMVFMTFNWRHILETRQAELDEAWKLGVRVTIFPSSCSMLTALLGFLSLLAVPATPLRQLGAAGMIGTVIAFGAAYLIYPFFLRLQRPSVAPAREGGSPAARTAGFFTRRHGWIAGGLLAAAGIASIGLARLDTEPSIFAYFKRTSEIRRSLEYIDQNGGSVPLNVVVANPDGKPFKFSKAYSKLWELSLALEREPAVGGVVSLPLYLAGARQSFWVRLVPIPWVVKALESRAFGQAARYYVSSDHTKVLFLVRMKETYTRRDHLANVARIQDVVRAHGLDPVITGGPYILYGDLTRLVSKSVVEGQAFLVALFIVIGFLISRSLRIAGALVPSLVLIPVLMLGLLGWLGVALDIISAPGANIALGIGVDAMVHLLVWVKRHPAGSMRSRQAWGDVCGRLWKPILYSMSVVGAGFAIFLLSTFPPTQRFGIAVILGTLIAPLAALFVLPWFATVGNERPRPGESGGSATRGRPGEDPGARRPEPLP